MANVKLGYDFTGWEWFCHTVTNLFKNHWRQNNVCAALTGKQPGMIINDALDERLYLVLGLTGLPCSEIIQTDIPVSDDKYIEFGESYYGAIGFNSTNQAFMLGVAAYPSSGLNQRGLILCDIQDIAADLTALIPEIDQPQFSIVDLDIDSFVSFGWDQDDIPFITAGGNADKIKFGVEHQMPVTITPVSDPPTDAELDALWTSPAAVGLGWWAFLQSITGTSDVWIIMSDGGNWWYSKLTMAL